MGGERPQGEVIPFVLPADLTFLFLLKFGEEVPTVTKLGDLSDFQIPLDEAWIKLIGLCPSLQIKIYKESVNADIRAHMLREIYHVVMQSKREHASVYASVQLQVPERAIQILSRVHHDPATSTVRPTGHERDPYLHMTAGLHHEILSELVDRLLPRFLHLFCKRDDLSVQHDVPAYPLSFSQIPREKKKNVRNEYHSKIKAFLDKREASTTSKLNPQTSPTTGYRAPWPK